MPPIRRVYIPKAGQPHKRRPPGIPEVEDRLLQAAINRPLQPIYEADFVEGSYGFRPGRSPHDALDALNTTMMTRPMQWVFEADIRGFFDHLQHGWLMTMLRERIGDLTLVCWRYLFLAEEIRSDQDLRSVGSLFFVMVDELADLTWAMVWGSGTKSWPPFRRPCGTNWI